MSIGTHATRIALVGKVVTGRTPSVVDPALWGGPLEFITPADIDEDGSLCRSARSLSSAGKVVAQVVPQHSVVFVGIGATLGKTAVVDREIAINQQCHAVLVGSERDAVLLREILDRSSHLFWRRAGNGGMPILPKATFEKVEVLWPDEQGRTKVFRSLAALNQLRRDIETLIHAKRTLKRGLMQQLLTGRTRFQEFRDRAWVRRPFSEFFVEKSVGNSDRIAELVYSCTKTVGIVPQAERFGKRLASKDLARYKVVEPGDLVYDPMLLWDGSIGFVPVNGRGVVSPAYETFTVSQSANRAYFWPLLKSYNLLHRYKQISQGTNTRRRKAHPGDFLKTVVSMPPTKEEQDRIADVLSTAQREIDQLEQLHELIDDYRRALLSKLLSGSLPVPA